MAADVSATANDVPGWVRFAEYGLSVFTWRECWFPEAVRSGRQPVMQTHSHLEVEFKFVESGRVVMELPGVTEEVRPFEPVMYWGGAPHRILDMAPGSVFHVVQVPLVDALSWANSAPLLGLLLEGRFLREEPDPVETAAEPIAFARWGVHLRLGDWGLRRAAELEIEARFRRFESRLVEPTGPSIRGSSSVTADRLATVTRFVMSHFTEPITVDDVASAVGWHRAHLLASFRRFCGITLWSYVTRVRLAEAQRLLAATDLPTLEVCHRAGFGSTSQMYDVFKRHRGTTPARYRRATAAAAVSP